LFLSDATIDQGHVIRKHKKATNRVTERSRAMGQAKEFAHSESAPLNYFEMAVKYACGRDVVADLIEAHKWFNIAALRGDVEAARRRQELAAEMGAAEVAAAQRRAREFLAAA
jgi:uncharacterized protein